MQSQHQPPSKFPESHFSNPQSLASQKCEHDAAGDRGAEDAGEVRTHSMHQKEDAAAFLLPDEVGDAGCDRNGSDTSRADQRIDAAAGQLIHDLGTDHAAAGTEGKRHKAQKDDKYGRGREEGIRSHGRANGDRQDQRNHIEKGIGRCFRQLADDEAFAQEISKHQHGDERRNRRQEHINDECHDDRECDLLEARRVCQVLCVNFFC